jgi:hypothetical protein
VLDSALSLFADGRPYYRAHDALALAGAFSFEQVAEPLWSGTLPAAGHGWMVAQDVAHVLEPVLEHVEAGEGAVVNQAGLQPRATEFASIAAF